MTDAQLDKKLAELRVLVDRMERIASPFGKPVVEMLEDLRPPQAERESLRFPNRAIGVAADACDAPRKEQGAIEAAANRVNRLTNIVGNIRDRVNSTALRVFGSTGGMSAGPASADKSDARQADIHGLITALDRLDGFVEQLESEAAYLCGQL